MKLTGVSLVLAALVACTVGAVSSVSGVAHWEVRDSKGRTRIESFEEGEGFGILLRDHLGNRRIAVQCDAGGSPSIAFYDDTGGEMLRASHAGETGPGLTICAPGGVPITIASHPTDGAAIGVGSSKGGRSALLGVNKSGGVGLTLSRREGDKESKTVLFAMPSSLSGLYVEQDDKRLAGLVSEGDRGMLWVGSNAMDGSQDGLGIRLGWDPEVGAALTMRHTPKSNHVVLQDYEKLGSGLQVGRVDGGYFRGGVNREGTPRLLLASPNGDKLVELPAK